tara:strand:+ start:191 stop:355 length:165 start_codon:yes stop_codon:yes gene_type:complete
MTPDEEVKDALNNLYDAIAKAIKTVDMYRGHDGELRARLYDLKVIIRKKLKIME